MEEPVMLFGNDQAWRRMCLPHADHIEINIQPDLQWELKREEYVKLVISSGGHSRAEPALPSCVCDSGVA